jgi:hypothetical protein
MNAFNIVTTQLIQSCSCTRAQKLLNSNLQGSSIPPTLNGGSTLVTLPRIVTPYRDSVDGTRARVTYQKLVTR